MRFGRWAVIKASASCCLAIETLPRAGRGARRLANSRLCVARGGEEDAERSSPVHIYTAAAEPWPAARSEVTASGLWAKARRVWEAHRVDRDGVASTHSNTARRPP